MPAAKSDPRNARAKYVAVQVAAHVAAGAVGFMGVHYYAAPAVADRLREPGMSVVDCAWSDAAKGANPGCIYEEVAR